MMDAGSQFRAVTEWLATCRRPLLFSHRRPDGDALGALAATAVALRRRGAQPNVALFDPLPERYGFLADGLAARQWAEDGERLERESDSLIILDTCSLAQLEPAADFIGRAPRTLVIDHHATRDAIGEREGDLQLLDVTAAAACVLIAEWALQAGNRLDAELATPLFVGIATDCGWFRYSNTDARTLAVAGLLVGAGVSVSELYAQLYQQDSPARMRLVARALGSLQLLAADRLAVMVLRKADFVACGADLTMTEDIVNEPARLACTEATILLIEQDDGAVRVNFRSKRWLDVAALARQFGGGGHVRAAGARIADSVDQAVVRVISATVAALQAGGPPGV